MLYIKKNNFLKLTILVVIVSALTVTWGISKAQNNSTSQSKSIQNYSVLGTVSIISTSTNSISIIDATPSDGSSLTDFTFDLSKVDKIQSSDYTVLTIDQISPADKVILQGTEDNSVVTIKRVIDMSWTGVIATSSEGTTTEATSTPDIATSTIATSTDVVASSTSNVATSTTIDNLATSTNDIATSTNVISISTESQATSTDSVSTTTTDIASSTIATSTDNITASSTPVIVPPPAPDNSATSSNNSTNATSTE